MDKTIKKRKHKWNYKSLALFILSMALAIYLLTSAYLKSLILSLGIYYYLGALVSGFFFAYGLTAAPATATFLILGKINNPILIGLLGGLGAMIGDFLIFMYVKKKLPPDIKYLAKKTGITKLKHLRHTKIGWIVPLIAGIIIASPLPDELGGFILSISNYPVKKFLIFSYLMNSLGITIIALLG